MTDKTGSTQNNNPCNCATCTDITCWLCEGNPYYDKVISFPKHRQERREHLSDIQQHRDQVKKKGCLSHPQAREYLMLDIIDVLKTQSQNRKQFPNNPYAKGQYDAFEEAIALIKEGVQK